MMRMDEHLLLQELHNLTKIIGKKQTESLATEYSATGKIARMSVEDIKDAQRRTRYVKIGPCMMTWADGTTRASPGTSTVFGYGTLDADLVVTRFRIEADDDYEPWLNGYRWVIIIDAASGAIKTILPQMENAPDAWLSDDYMAWISPQYRIPWDLIHPEEPLVIKAGDVVTSQQFNATGASVIYNYEMEYYYDPSQGQVEG